MAPNDAGGKPALPPEVMSPLGPFKGAKPPAPHWFDWAIAQEPERTFVESGGARIESLAWGERGKPGLLFVHGASANADWWSFIAPFFADDYRIVAMSLSGMGRSDWRPRYAFEVFAQEMHDVADAAGLNDAPVKPIYIGHSFGGAAVYFANVGDPDRIRASLLIDSGFGRRPPKQEDQEAAVDMKPAAEDKKMRIYPTFEAALARFRFMPPQVPGNLFVADWIARHSIREVETANGEKGFTWRFDPMLFPHLDRSGIMGLIGRKPGPVSHIYGDRSNVIERSGVRPDILGADVPKIVIPDSDHHIMVDQPLALVSTIRAVLAYWPR
jgi:pimeloyl-ACP methyl ester carboxylesterase